MIGEKDALQQYIFDCILVPNWNTKILKSVIFREKIFFKIKHFFVHYSLCGSLSSCKETKYFPSKSKRGTDKKCYQDSKNLSLFQRWERVIFNLFNKNVLFISATQKYYYFL